MNRNVLYVEQPRDVNLARTIYEPGTLVDARLLYIKRIEFISSFYQSRVSGIESVSKIGLKSYISQKLENYTSVVLA